MPKTLQDLEAEGGPAFPPRMNSDGNGYQDQHGMSLRDYFAAHAIPAAVASFRDGLGTRDRPLDLSPDADCDGNGNVIDAGIVADYAYVLADAMLSARKTPPVA